MKRREEKGRRTRPPVAATRCALRQWRSRWLPPSKKTGEESEIPGHGFRCGWKPKRYSDPSRSSGSSVRQNIFQRKNSAWILKSFLLVARLRSVSMERVLAGRPKLRRHAGDGCKRKQPMHSEARRNPGSLTCDAPWRSSAKMRWADDEMLRTVSDNGCCTGEHCAATCASYTGFPDRLKKFQLPGICRVKPKGMDPARPSATAWRWVLDPDGREARRARGLS